MAKRRRGNGEGSVWKVKGRKLWGARISYQVGRKNKSLTRYGRTKAEAMKKLTEMTNEKNQGGIVAPDKTSFGRCVDQWLKSSASERVGIATLARYEGLAKNHIKPNIGRVKLSKITPDHIQFVMDQMKESGLSSSSRRQCFTVMNQTCRRELLKRSIKYNPCDAVQCPSTDHTEHTILSREQLDTFFSYSKDDPYHALYILVVTTGMRISEMLGLKWDDIDFKTGSVSIQRKVIQVGGKNHIGKPKTKASRRNVTLSQIAIKALQEHQKRNGNAFKDYVFTNTRGGLVSQNNLRTRHFKPLLKETGLPDIGFHTFRHTCATLLLKEGVHPKIVQELLGHSKTSVTMDIYSHILENMHKEASNVFDEMLG